jgi:hypothetical protein
MLGTFLELAATISEGNKIASYPICFVVIILEKPIREIWLSRFEAWREKNIPVLSDLG